MKKNPIILLVLGMCVFSLSFVMTKTFADDWELNSTNITQAPFNCSIDATNCDLSEKNITSIAADTFVNHHYLLFLNLSNNQITSLPENIFQGDIPLVSIVLSANNLTTLPGNIFQWLSNLQYVFLDNNLISSLPNSIFDSCSHLIVLYLSDNNLIQLNENVFWWLGNLKELHLDSNQLASLSGNVFWWLDELEYLYLNDNKLVSLGNISSLTSLATWWLDIDNNRINYNLFSQDIVDFLDQKAENWWRDTQTFWMILNSWNIDIICPQEATVCGLSGRNIYAIDADTFVNHHSLQSLDLSKNRITDLPVGLFDPLTGLLVLDVSQNQITSLWNINVLGSLIDGSEIDYGLHSQSWLNIQRNYINPALLSHEMFLFLNQKSIQMKDSMWMSTQTYTPIVFTWGEVNSGNIILFWEHCRPWTDFCQISGQSITSIAADTFTHYNLHTLSITNTLLTTLPNWLLSTMPELSNLELWHNQISFLQEWMFTSVPNLTTLNLEHNQLTGIWSSVFSSLSWLTSLNIGYNQLTEIWSSAFTNLSWLTSLNISHNQLTDVSWLFNGLNNIHRLNLNNNTISAVGGIESLDSLNEWHLNLYDNAINYHLLDNSVVDFINIKHDQSSGDWRRTQIFSELVDLPTATSVGISGDTALWSALHGSYEYSHTLSDRATIIDLPEELSLVDMHFDKVTHQLFGIGSDNIVYWYTGDSRTSLATIDPDSMDVWSLTMNDGHLYILSNNAVYEYSSEEWVDITWPLPDEWSYLYTFVVWSWDNVYALTTTPNEGCSSAGTFDLYLVNNQERTFQKSVEIPPCPDNYAVFVDSDLNIYTLEVLSSKVTFLRMTRNGERLFDSSNEVRAESELYMRFDSNNVPYFPMYMYWETNPRLFRYDNNRPEEYEGDPLEEVLDIGEVWASELWSDYSAFTLDHENNIFLTKLRYDNDLEANVTSISLYSGNEIMEYPDVPQWSIVKFAVSPENNLPYLLWYDEWNVWYISTYTTHGIPEWSSQYQWYRNGVAISGATSSEYVLTQNDLWTSLRFEVTPYTLFGLAWSGGMSSAISIPDPSVVPSQPTSPWWWWGTSYLLKDICEEKRDCSSSYYDNICGPCPTTTWHFAAPLSWDTNSPYSSEITSAYQWAYGLGITTKNTIQEANIDTDIIRAHLAKMVSEYAIKVQKKKPDTSLACNFTDTSSLSKEMRFYATLACQLWLMGLKSDWTPNTVFSPNGETSRAEFATILSRMLYGDVYNTKPWESVKWYSKHVQALYNNWIITKIDNLFSPEKRGWIFVMLHRTVE
jgi:Leucine-rich repeat (LRR) protein